MQVHLVWIVKLTWQISQRGSLSERQLRRSLWCLLASLLAAWISKSHLAHRAASSAQQMSAAGALSHTSHWIFIFFDPSELRHTNPNTKKWKLGRRDFRRGFRGWQLWHKIKWVFREKQEIAVFVTQESARYTYNRKTTRQNLVEAKPSG